MPVTASLKCVALQESSEPICGWIVCPVIWDGYQFIFIGISVGIKQCHKPAMTGNGNHTTYKHGTDWGMVGLWHCFTHMSQCKSIIFAFPWHGMDDPWSMYHVLTPARIWPDIQEHTHRDVPANDERQKKIYSVWNTLELYWEHRFRLR